MKSCDESWLDEQNFYEVCQRYRHAKDGYAVPGMPTAAEAFEDLKNFIASQIGVACQRSETGGSQWIPLSERVPEGAKDVLVAHEVFGRGNERGVAIRSASSVRVWGTASDDTSMLDTFWMPLPEAPK